MSLTKTNYICLKTYINIEILSIAMTGRQRKIAEYYKRQNKLLKGFNELDLFSETGFWPGSLTEVCC